MGGDATTGDLLQIQLAGKMLVGQRELQKMSESAFNDTANEGEASDDAAEVGENLSAEEIKTFETAIDAANTGTYEQQLACAVLQNELLGPERALESLDDLSARVEEHKFKPSEAQATLRDGITNVVRACAK